MWSLQLSEINNIRPMYAVKTLYSKADIIILQGSVAKCLRCGGIFNNHFIVNLPPSAPVKEF